MQYAIETSKLSHRFGTNSEVLHLLDLQVPVGSVYGFLGPNGAGKTTTLKILLGLIRQQSGEVRLLGQPLQTHRGAILRRTGSMIESPSLYAHLSARENLRIWQILFQCPANRIEEVLTLTGLAHTGSKKTGKFSLGMKQRLGIAVSLLHQPDLLILDEPVNGLDPEGILEMRELMLTLHRQHGVTTVVSSHLLPEMEKMATHLGIIHKGHLLFQGLLTDLLSRARQSSHLVSTSDNPQALLSLQGCGIEATLETGRLEVLLPDEASFATMIRCICYSGLDIHDIIPKKNDLELSFLQLVQS